jgi:hypothetical protein
LPKRILHSFGAIQCLTRLLEMLHEQGFILINDYGNTHVSRANDFEHQRFSYATAVGVNFSLLKGFFGHAGKCEWLEASGDDERGIHTRPMSRQPGSEVRLRFQQMFSKASFDALAEPIQKARGCVRYGVPGRILIPVVAELTLHEIWDCGRRFAELLRILEKTGEPVCGAIWIFLPN